jgi:hypothetical protein
LDESGSVAQLQFWKSVSLFIIVSTSAVWPTQVHIECVAGGLSPWIQLSRCEAGHLVPYLAEVKNKWRHSSTSMTSTGDGLLYFEILEGFLPKAI